jgi:hypothetical protein
VRKGERKRKMEEDIHLKLSNYFFDCIHQYYYQPLIHEKKKTIQDALIKPEYLQYSLFYCIYSLSNAWSCKDIISFQWYLHSFYILYLLDEKIRKEYSYTSKYNLSFLNQIAFYLYFYILSMKFYFHPCEASFKNMSFTSLSVFSLMMNYHEAYVNRLKTIEYKKEPEHHIRKIFIFTPNKKIMKQIVYHTRHFTFSNLLFLISFLAFCIL